MQCSCGRETAEHKVIRNHEVVGVYERCVGCGRILWLKKTVELEKELKELT